MLKNRDLVKLEMIRDRGGIDFANMPPCDYCHKRKAIQMHERIKRSQTIRGSEARNLSFQKELCNLLCLECHPLADTIEVDKELWLFSIHLYGRIKVQEAIDNLQEVTRHKLIFEGFDESTL